MAVKVTLCDSAAAVADRAAELLIAAVRAKPDLVLGLPTGSTVLALYRRLVRAGRAGRISFRRVACANLDEYLGLGPEHPQSYAHTLRETLFRHLDADPARIHSLQGGAADPAREATRYERLIESLGGFDLLLLGLGVNGHIAFNEPGSASGSRTRVVELAPATLRANSRYFADAGEQPTRAITIGIGTILEARRIVVLATGKTKAAAVKAMLSGAPVSDCPAAALADHPDVQLMLDCAAAGRSLD
ncbi:MAG: glucosamine-6-phosphate deaminase [Kiloniellales bacterium]